MTPASGSGGMGASGSGPSRSQEPIGGREDTTPTLEDLWDPSEEDEVGSLKASLKASVSPTRSPT